MYGSTWTCLRVYRVHQTLHVALHLYKYRYQILVSTRFSRYSTLCRGPTCRGHCLRGGITLQHLLYANDLAGLSGSFAELQRLLRHGAQHWYRQDRSHACGYCCASRRPRAAVAARSRSSLCRYLGEYYLSLLSDLRDDDAADFLLSHLDYLWHAQVRHAAFQMQYHSTMAQGSLRHLRALTTISAATAGQLEQKLLGHVRVIPCDAC